MAVVVTIIIIKSLNVSNDPNYIEATYSCAGWLNKIDIFQSNYSLTELKSLISSITVDGKEVDIQSSLYPSKYGNITVIINFKKPIEDMSYFFKDCFRLLTEP